jgi:cysteinyl-tRNA synthetase
VYIIFINFDFQGIPTHDQSGEEITKSKRKKLQKEYDQQVKLHEEYKKHFSGN